MVVSPLSPATRERTPCVTESTTTGMPYEGIVTLGSMSAGSMLHGCVRFTVPGNPVGIRNVNAASWVRKVPTYDPTSRDFENNLRMSRNIVAPFLLAVRKTLAVCFVDFGRRLHLAGNAHTTTGTFKIREVPGAVCVAGVGRFPGHARCTEQLTRFRAAHRCQLVRIQGAPADLSDELISVGAQ